MRVVAVGLVALLLVPLAWRTLPAMGRTIRSALELARVPREARRQHVLGAWARASADLRARLPRGATVDLVLVDPGAVEAGPFLAGDLVPRPLWCYDGWEAWRARRPMTIVRDARGVNAAQPPPARADVVVEFDTRRDPPARVIAP